MRNCFMFFVEKQEDCKTARTHYVKQSKNGWYSVSSCTQKTEIIGVRNTTAFLPMPTIWPKRQSEKAYSTAHTHYQVPYNTFNREVEPPVLGLNRARRTAIKTSPTSIATALCETIILPVLFLPLAGDYLYVRWRKKGRTVHTHKTKTS